MIMLLEIIHEYINIFMDNMDSNDNSDNSSGYMLVKESTVCYL